MFMRPRRREKLFMLIVAPFNRRQTSGDFRAEKSMYAAAILPVLGHALCFIPSSIYCGSVPATAAAAATATAACWTTVFFTKNQNAPRPSEHPPVRGGEM